MERRQKWGSGEKFPHFLYNFAPYPLAPLSLTASSTNLESSVVVLASLFILKAEKVVCSMVIWLGNRREDYRGIHIILKFATWCFSTCQLQTTTRWLQQFKKKKFSNLWAHICFLDLKIKRYYDYHIGGLQSWLSFIKYIFTKNLNEGKPCLCI